MKRLPEYCPRWNRSSPPPSGSLAGKTSATSPRGACCETPPASRLALPRDRSAASGASPSKPRPYQLVPLMMALQLDPVRMLIADDVGIGKTIEACVIARELLDRGEIRRLAVLCPPPLAEQWQRELAEKVPHRRGARAVEHRPASGARPPRRRVGLRKACLYHRIHRLHQEAAARRGLRPSVPGVGDRRRSPRLHARRWRGKGPPAAARLAAPSDRRSHTSRPAGYRDPAQWQRGRVPLVAEPARPGFRQPAGRLGQSRP